jgi:hypothetical protein
MQKAARVWGEHFLRRNVEEVPGTIVVIGPIPKPVARVVGKPFGVRVPPGLKGGTSGIRMVSQKLQILRPMADFVKRRFAVLWVATEAVLAWQSTFDTWADPRTWTMLDDAE